MANEEAARMLRVTWEWIDIDEPALDLANTIAVDKGVEHDLLAPAGEYERWAYAAARSAALKPDEAAALIGARPHVRELREHIRAVLRATVAGERLPPAAVAAVNRASAAAPHWPELNGDGGVQEYARGDPVDRLLGMYARSAIQITADRTAELRVCGAPSCGMYYRPRRGQQRWCSTQCGTRARVARHYKPRGRR
jgi:predicted RNA-binding Zn ribbon-like protein